MPLIPIDGAKYNTRKLQEENFSHIQAKGNTLYGEKRLPKIPAPIAQVKKEALPKEPPKELPKTLPETKLAKNEPYYNKNLTGTGLQLNGASDNHKKIADKYSMFFKNPIAIDVVKDDKDFVSNKGQGIGGLNSYYTDGSRKIQVRGDLDDEAFEMVMLHEIAHNVFHYDEDSAWKYANEMMNVVNNQK